jgi:hypothetical protein
VPGPVTKHLLEMYTQVVRGQLPQYRSWCEYVNE